MSKGEEISVWDKYPDAAEAFDEWISSLIDLIGIESSGTLGHSAWAEDGWNEEGHPSIYDVENPLHPNSHWNLEIFEQTCKFVASEDDKESDKENDGAELFSGYFIDISALIRAFGPSATVHICCDVSLPGDMGIPHVSIEGVYKGRPSTVILYTRPTSRSKTVAYTNSKGHFWEADDDDEDEED